MKTLLVLISTVPLQLFPVQEKQNEPKDFHPIKFEIGLYGDNKKEKAELWKHDRLNFYRAVIRHPYQTFYVEEDGQILGHKEYKEWGNYHTND